MEVYDIINAIIDLKGYKKYLEIGYGDGYGYPKVKCTVKHTIDPDPPRPDPFVIRKSSDEFFNWLRPSALYDLIFIDGDHSAKQVALDITNSLLHLTCKGCLVLHDVCPAEENLISPKACGDGYKAFAHLRMTRRDLKMFVVDCYSEQDKTGWGVICRGEQEIWPEFVPNVTWEYLAANRKAFMNMKAPEVILQYLESNL